VYGGTDPVTAASIPPSVLAFAAPVILFLALWALCYGPLASINRVVEASAKHVSARLLGSRAGIWVARHAGPFGPYAPMILVLVLGGAAAIGAGYLFVELAEEARVTTSIVYRVDQAVQAWFGHMRQPAVTTLLRAATNIGGAAGLATLVSVVAALLLARRERASAIFVLVTSGAGALLNLGLKLIFARARPDLASAIAEARWYSFPSGHAMSSLITFGALAYLVLRQPWPWKARSAGLAVAVAMVVLVGLSRVYLGVHWASDIAGGWSAGTVWLISAVAAFEMLLRLRGEKVVPP
jgi:membrane-associated phospholipid phosphatase